MLVALFHKHLNARSKACLRNIRSLTYMGVHMTAFQGDGGSRRQTGNASSKSQISDQHGSSNLRQLASLHKRRQHFKTCVSFRHANSFNRFCLGPPQPRTHFRGSGHNFRSISAQHDRRNTKNIQKSGIPSVPKKRAPETEIHETEEISFPTSLDPISTRKYFEAFVGSWRVRAASFTRESALLIYSALIDNTLVVALEWLKIDLLLRKLQPILEQASSVVFGSYRELENGRRVPISLVNNTSPDFGIPDEVYQPSTLSLSHQGYDPFLAHLSSLLMKVVYEEPEVIKDIAERDWGMTFHAYHSTQTIAESLYDLENDNTSDFIPRTRACILSSKEGIFIAFRGSEPLNLINLRSSGKITMSPRFEMGSIHDGFYTALFHSDPDKGSLFDQIMSTLKSLEIPPSKPIVLAGHSLGSSLCMVFAAALQRQHEDYASRISSIYTFGMPRVGDKQFGQKMEGCYEGKIFRITHAADIIPLVPPRFLQYSHFGKEYYITSIGQLVEGKDGIRKARKVETFGFLPLYFYKLVTNLLLNPREGILRTVYRLVMLVSFPGLNDHFPSDYSYKLGRLLKKTKIDHS